MNLAKLGSHEYSNNMIVTAKLGKYIPYRSIRFPNQKSSLKKIDPIHIKAAEQFKKNKRILSKNDRLDLFLEGGQVSEKKITSHQDTIINRKNRTFYKTEKGKRKS